MFNGILRTKNSYYYGRESYKHIDRLIAKSKNLYIISPFIDRYYANYIRSHSRGKQIHILSSSISPEAKAVLSGKGHLGAKSFTKIFVSLLLINFVSFYFHLLFVYVFIASVIITLASVALMRRKKNGNIRLRIPSRFVHMKLYVSDYMAIEGSANLTYNGMHKNIEHINVTYDKHEVKRLQRQFWKEWSAS